MKNIITKYFIALIVLFNFNTAVAAGLPTSTVDEVGASITIDGYVTITISTAIDTGCSYKRLINISPEHPLFDEMYSNAQLALSLNKPIRIRIDTDKACLAPGIAAVDGIDIIK